MHRLEGRCYGEAAATLQFERAFALVLKDGQRIRIRVDGKVLSEGATTSTSIPFLHRGEHQISAELVDHNGRIVSRDQVTVISRWPNN